MRVIYPQLDPDALALINARVAVLGSRAKVAAELGYARSALSQAMDGKYPGDTRHLRAAVISAYASRVSCPHLGTDLSPEQCRDNRERTMQEALGSRDTVKLWQACRSCPQNPAAKRATTESGAA